MVIQIFYRDNKQVYLFKIIKKFGFGSRERVCKNFFESLKILFIETKKKKRERPKEKRVFFFCNIEICPHVFLNTRRRLDLEDRGFKNHSARTP